MRRLDFIFISSFIQNVSQTLHVSSSHVHCVCPIDQFQQNKHFHSNELKKQICKHKNNLCTEFAVLKEVEDEHMNCKNICWYLISIIRVKSLTTCKTKDKNLLQKHQHLFQHLVVVLKPQQKVRHCMYISLCKYDVSLKTIICSKFGS